MTEDIEGSVVRLRDGADGWAKVDGPTLTPEDPFLTGLGEDEAETLVQRNWALRRSSVEDAEAFYADDADDGDDESTEDSDATADEWSEEAWLEPGYQERVDKVEAGDVDDHLHDIREVETSETVIDAVDERLAEVTDGVHGTPDEE